jgi:hypothetical protein
MPRLIPLALSCGLALLLVACSAPLGADAMPGISMRAQQLCAAAIKDGRLQNCIAIPFNVSSAQLSLTDAAKQKGVVTAWCAQYDYSQLDKTNLWSETQDTVFIAQAQDGSYTFTPITNLPPEGCGGYKLQ